jgi:hypothetical protein
MVILNFLNLHSNENIFSKSGNIGIEKMEKIKLVSLGKSKGIIKIKARV